MSKPNVQEFVYSDQTYHLQRRILPAPGSLDPTRILVGTYLGDRLIATNDYEPGDPFADDLPEPVFIALLGGEAFPGITATLYAALALDSLGDDEDTLEADLTDDWSGPGIEGSWEEDDDSTSSLEPWKASVPEFTGGYSTPGEDDALPIDEPGPLSDLNLGLVPLGRIHRLTEVRKHPEDVVAELSDMLRTISEGKVTRIADQILEALAQPHQS